MRRHRVDDSEVSTLGADTLVLEATASTTSQSANLVEEERQRRRRWEHIDKWIRATKRRHAEQDASFLRANADVLFNSAMIVPPLLAALGAYAYHDHESRVAESQAQALYAQLTAEEAAKGTAPPSGTTSLPLDDGPRLPHYDDSAFAADYDD